MQMDSISSHIFTIGKTDYVDNEKGGVQKGIEVAPFIDNASRTQLPVRTVANALGISDENIKWNGVAKTVTIVYGEKTVVMTIGSNIITVNGEKVTIDTAPIIKDSRTFLPLRALANALGISDENIYWNDETKQVLIRKAK